MSLQVVAKAVVRTKPSVNSALVAEMAPGATIVVIEETQCDGHHRARIGIDEWVSLKTAKGAVLAVASVSSAAVSAVPVVSLATEVHPYLPNGSLTASASGGQGAVVTAQPFAEAVEVEPVERAHHVGSHVSANQPITAAVAGLHVPLNDHLGLPPTGAAPLPVGGSTGQLITLAPTGVLYTTVTKAVVRTGPSLSSPVVRELPPKYEVTIFEERSCDGHNRGRIGPGQWMSIQTAKGKVLAVPGNLEAAQTTPVFGLIGATPAALAQPAPVHAATVVAPVAGTVQASVAHPNATPSPTAAAAATAQVVVVDHR